MALNKTVPAIPVPSGVERNVERVLSPIKETLDIWAGRHGNPNDRAVTVRELVDLIQTDATINVTIATVPHTHAIYLEKAGGIMTGALELDDTLKFGASGQTINEIATTLSGSGTNSQLATAAAVEGYADGAITTHSGDTDPHGDRSYTDTEISSHVSDTDPHGDRSYADSAITTHEGAADPHTGYQLESEKSTADGYASLNASGYVPTDELGSGTPDGTKYLRDDSTWQTITTGTDTDEKAKVSANDTTAGYFEDKIVVSAGTNTTNILELSTLNDGSDEDLQLQIDEGKIDHDSLTNTHNLSTDIDHDGLTNTHNLSTDIDHDGLTNTHNLSTDIDHDALTNFESAEHIDWSVTGAEDLHDDRIAASSVTQHVGSIDHDSLLNTHNLTTDIDHSQITGAHNLTTDIDHASITGTHNLSTDIDHNGLTNTHNLTTSIDHDQITNTHNLTTDIDHDQLTNFEGNEHIDWTVTGVEDIHDDRIAASSVTQHLGSIDHDSLLNTHNLTTDIDHDQISNTHNLTTSIDHDQLTNAHNLTTDIDHDQLTNFVADEHIDWSVTGVEDVHDDRVPSSAVTQHVGSIDHDSLLNTHGLTTDIDHDQISNTHNLTTDIDHDQITNTHNLTTSIDHDQITNTHNLTTDIDHSQLTNLETGDPHTQYQQESEKSNANGYASLNASGYVPPGELGSGTPDGTLFLRDDNTWQLPAGGGLFTEDAYGNIYGGSSVGVNLTSASTYNFLTVLGAGASIDTGDFNIGIGYQTVYYNQDGSDNIALGTYALRGDSSSEDNYGQNIGIGNNALTKIKNGASNNVAIGLNAGYNVWAGTFNSFFGVNAGQGAATQSNAANNNVAVGYNALASYDGADNNVCIGLAAGRYISTSSSNVFIGSNAGVSLSSTPLTNGNNVCVGAGAGSGIITVATGNVFLGANTGSAITSGSYNIGIGQNTLYYGSTCVNVVAIGYQAHRGVASYTGTVPNYNVAIGNQAMYGADNGAANSVAIGVQAAQYCAGINYSVFMGAWAGYGDMAATDHGNSNIGIGSYSLYKYSTASTTIAIGANAMYETLGGSYNTAIGYGAARYLNQDAADTGLGNVVIGENAGRGPTGGGSVDYSYNVTIGSQTNLNRADGSHHIAIGTLAAYEGTGNTGSISIGYHAGYYNKAQTSWGNYSICIGYNAGQGSSGNSEFSDAILIGTNAGQDLTTGHNTICIGKNAGANTTTGTNCIYIGQQAGYYNVTGDLNTAVGFTALNGNVSGSGADGGNAAFGYAALAVVNGGTYNLGVGTQAGAAVTSGARNAIFGYQAGYTLTEGSDNVLLGAFAGDDLTTEDDQLRIENATSALITGDFSTGDLTLNADVSVTGTFEFDTGGQAVSSITTTVDGSSTNAELPTAAAVYSALDNQPGKNWVINGNFDVWQRGTSFTSTGTQYDFTADRWVKATQGDSCSVAQGAFGAGTTDVPYNPRYALAASTTYSTGASNYTIIATKVENVRVFSGENAVLSFYVKGNGGTYDIGIEATQAFGTGGSTEVTGIGTQACEATSGTYTKYEISITFPSISGKTLGTGHSTNINFWLSAGSTFSSRSSSIGEQSSSIVLALVQLEKGTVATPFEQLSYGETLSLCQRYYCATGATTRYTAAAASEYGETHVYWPVTMAGVPTTSLTSSVTTNCTSQQLLSPNAKGARHVLLSAAAGDTYDVAATVTAEAEI